MDDHLSPEQRLAEFREFLAGLTDEEFWALYAWLIDEPAPLSE